MISAASIRRLGALLGALLLAACDSPGEGVAPVRPNVVLVSIDSLRADHLGAYGYGPPTSPRIDALAAGGARFAEAISTTSWTLPAHAALFTGLFDVAHGVTGNGMALAGDHRTLAEAFGAAGYHTAGFFGGPYLHETFGLGQGFDVYQSCMTRIADDLSGDHVRREARASRAAASHADVTGPRTIAEIERWLEAAPAQPVFLFVHLWDVHYDYTPPERYVSLFDPDYEGDLDPRDMIRNPEIRADMDPRDRAHLVARYDGEIRFTDDNLGEILDRLERAGLLEDAIVAVTSDHGQEFFEHRGKGHQRTLFDEVVRVPLIVHAPGLIPAGSVVEDPVRLIDVMPTLLSLAGVPLPKDVQGRDLSPLLNGEPLGPAPALLDLAVNPTKLRALRTDGLKLVVSNQGRFALYDLAADPGETESLTRSDPRYEPARRGLQALREEAEAFGAARSRGVARPERDEDVRRRLEALGYLDGGPAGDGGS